MATTTTTANTLSKDDREIIRQALEQAHSSAERGIKAARNDKMREAWQEEADKIRAVALKITNKELAL